MAERSLTAPAVAAGSAALSIATRIGVDMAVLGSAILLFGASVLGQVIGLAAQVMVARTIGVAGFGTYSWVVSWISLLALGATFGTDRLLTRTVAEHRSRGEQGGVRAVVGWTLRVALGAASLATLGLLAATGWLEVAGQHDRAVALAVGAAMLAPIVLAGVVESVLRASGAHLAATLPSRLVRPLAFGGLFAGVVAVRPELAGAVLALACNAGAILVSIAVCAAAWRRVVPHDRARTDQEHRRNWLLACLAFSIHAMALQLNGQLDILLLGIFQDDHAVGAYGAAVRLVTILGMPGTAVIVIIQPMIADAGAGGRQPMETLVRGGARAVAGSTVALAALVLIFAEPLLDVFGDGFSQGAAALRLLTLAAAAASLVSLAGPALNMTGHERDATAVMVIGALLTLGLGLLLIPAYGVIGAASTTAVSTVVWNLMLFGAARRRLGFWALPRGSA